ncbi:unnamed protein product [Phytophthora fragariaefolia]|uniref:Unnamed protein product n=1 Tax=Phytophthora fragariaefolia TaxID=1490495 RepID=A0A9W6TNH8_9STRA|nr:unnamed protein product [Phytophthora fragariaefolia]
MVYARYLEARTSTGQRYDDPTSTVVLKPVTNVEWDRAKSEFYRPSSQERKSRSNSQVVIFVMEEYIDKLVGTRTATLEQHLARIGSQQQQTQRQVRDLTMTLENRIDHVVTSAVNNLGDHLMQRLTNCYPEVKILVMEARNAEEAGLQNNIDRQTRLDAVDADSFCWPQPRIPTLKQTVMITTRLMRRYWKMQDVQITTPPDTDGEIDVATCGDQKSSFSTAFNNHHAVRSWKVFYDGNTIRAIISEMMVRRLRGMIQLFVSAPLISTKDFIKKMNDELASWIIAHELDFVVVSDPGFRKQRVEQIWITPSHTTSRVPGLLLVDADRAAIVMNKERWENRINRQDVVISPSRRSIRLSIRLCKGRTLWLLGLYCPHLPDRNLSAVEEEWEWMQTQIEIGRQRHAVIVVAGDFNTYSNDHLDRVAPEPRPVSSQHIDQKFGEWMNQCGLVSCFRVRHPTASRYTYARGAIKSNLDDIYVSSEHASATTSSGIWIVSIASSDHIGTPFASLRTNRGENISRTLAKINPIKVVNTKTKTQKDMDEFTLHTSYLLSVGQLQLIDDIDDTSSSPTEVAEWLEKAIDNVNCVLYDSAKSIWGETSQSTRHLARSVCISRSNRCSEQIIELKVLITLDDVQCADMLIALESTMWPNWVRFPEMLISNSAHQSPCLQLYQHLTGEQLPTLLEEPVKWVKKLCRLWTRVIKVRRNWRTTTLRRTVQERRRSWFASGDTRRFLDSALGRRNPPVSIRSAMAGSVHGMEYSEDKMVVQRELVQLLDNWIPPDERTNRPRYLDSRNEEDADELPEFVEQWILPDIRRGGRFADWWSGENAWDSHTYTAEMQAEIDRRLEKHVAPGFGTVSQEMWIAAPTLVRQRERRVIQMILQTGYAPKILKRMQMIFLPKTVNADPTLDNSRGLPQWRPITVLAALANRLNLIIKVSVEKGIPISVMQHGFQSERTVQDAALLTTLLFDRAISTTESIFVVSKDCLKYFDRVVPWVMEILYLGAGVPAIPLRLMIDLLGPGEIDVRTAFGWLSTGAREFRIGQGSILSIQHISCYMNTLQERLERCDGPVRICHHQEGGGIDIGSTVFVDDRLDISTTIHGLQARAEVTNLFTGKTGSGGGFGAEKSFMMYIDGNNHHEAVRLNNGLGLPQQVQVIAPREGFKYLGIRQGGYDLWSSSLEAPWKSIKSDAIRILPLQLSLPQLRYVVNRIWLPRLKYRMKLSGAIRLASDMDTFIRQVARTLPVYHVLMELLEAYQIRAGLVTNPFIRPIPPPVKEHSWVIEVIRHLAAIPNQINMVFESTSPPSCESSRSNDRSLVDATRPDLRETLVALNWYSAYKLQHVGDLCNEWGTRLLSQQALLRKGSWSTSLRNRVTVLYDQWVEALTSRPSLDLVEPVGCTPVDPNTLPYQMRIGVGQWILICQLDMDAPAHPMVAHEIGYRDNADVRQDEFGQQISIRWWYQRRPRSDLWYARTHLRTSWEYEASCVPISPTYLPQTRRQQQRVIVWNDTCINGIHGENDRAVLREAAARSLLRYESTLSDGFPLQAHTSCNYCGRFRNVKWCERCGRWHHDQCLLLNCCSIRKSKYMATTAHRITSVQYQWTQSTNESTTQAGDGSVVNAATPLASGSWATQIADGYLVSGKLNMHPVDLTSTRCELHAILAGLRFYWRARSGTLHTNAVKHRLDARWSPHCRQCHDERDTQSHRFGLSEPPCSSKVHLQHEISNMLWSLDKTLFLPDQTLFIPAYSHNLALATGLPERATWKESGAKTSLWKPMVEWTIRSVEPQIGLYKANVCLWTPGWSSVLFEPPIPISRIPALQQMESPANVASWWLDDVFRPKSEGWWEDFLYSRVSPNGSYWNQMHVLVMHLRGTPRRTQRQFYWGSMDYTNSSRTYFHAYGLLYSAVSNYAEVQKRVLLEYTSNTDWSRVNRPCNSRYHPSKHSRMGTNAPAVQLNFMASPAIFRPATHEHLPPTQY